MFIPNREKDTFETLSKMLLCHFEIRGDVSTVTKQDLLKFDSNTILRTLAVIKLIDM